MKIGKTILNIVDANKHIAVLENDLKKANDEKDQLQSSIDDLTAAHAKELADLKAEHKTALDEANGKVKLLTEANELLEDKQKSADEKAADIVAEQGVEQPVEEDKNAEAASEGKSLDDLWDEYRAISDQKEQRAFYLEHIKPLRK